MWVLKIQASGRGRSRLQFKLRVFDENGVRCTRHGMCQGINTSRVPATRGREGRDDLQRSSFFFLSPNSLCWLQS